MPSLFCAACAALVFACVSALTFSPATADSPKHVQVVQSFEPARNNGTPLVQVRFSNTVVGTFAIDTGEYECVMTDAFAQRLGLNVTDDKTLQFYPGFGFLRLLQIPKLQLDNLSITGQVFRIVTPAFLPLFSDRPIDGILGGDLLARFALRIDYPAHQIGWIMPGDLSAASAREMGFTPQNLIELGQQQTPWAIGKVNHYTLRADFQNGVSTASEDLMIDTGAPNTLISNPLAENLKLSPLGTEIAGTLSEPVSSVTRSTVAKMQIGQTTLSNVSVLAPQRKDTGFPSLLGENVLSDCVVLLDFGPHRFYLRPVLPPVKGDAAVPADKKQINWDRLRNAPDLPSLEEMLRSGFGPEAADTLAEQAKRLEMPLGDSAKDVERLEKLAVLRQVGGDNTGAKAAFAEAATKAAADAQVHPTDGGAAGRWVNSLLLAEQYDDALAAATQNTQRLPIFAPAWRKLGGVLTARTLFLLTGRQETLTESNALHLTIPKSTPPTQAQSLLAQSLLMQAHAALDHSLALAPTDAAGYRDRGVFWLVSRVVQDFLRQAKLKIKMPASETPNAEAALALTLADWQQEAALSLDDPEQLAIAAYLDRAVPFFHDRVWLTSHLKDTGRAVPGTLVTAQTAEAQLMNLTKNSDKTRAASAWTALGNVQLGKNEASPDADVSWRQALTLDPAKPEPLRLLAAHLRRNEKWTDLQSLLTEQCAVRDSVPLRLTLAVYSNGAGLPAEAEAQVRAAKTLAPENASVNLVLADFLLARSSGNPAALSEAKTCLDKAHLGFGALATAGQKATLATSEAVWLALDHDPVGAEKQLVDLANAQPNCTQVREALAALVPY